MKNYTFLDIHQEPRNQSGINLAVVDVTAAASHLKSNNKYFANKSNRFTQ